MLFYSTPFHPILSYFIPLYILFHSILFHPIPLYSSPFHSSPFILIYSIVSLSTLFHPIPSHSIILLYSILFHYYTYSIVTHSILFPNHSILFYYIRFHSILICCVLFHSILVPCINTPQFALNLIFPHLFLPRLYLRTLKNFNFHFLS